MELEPSLLRRGVSCWSFARKLSPCENSCPVNMNIPGFVISIAREEFDEAYAIMRESNPFPGVCGYVCHHPCEEACSRAKMDEPIAIKSLRRFVVDYKLRQGIEKVAPIKPTREKVAIIGSGPAGLTTAHDLVKQGYSVTVFEAMPVAGGMLATVIPEYRLSKKVLDTEIDYIKELGVEIKTNTPVGDLVQLFEQEYKAIFLGTGAGVSQKMWIPGEETVGVIHALDLLKQVNSGGKIGLGDRVAVIGGGNAAVDAARVALRLGAKEVTIVYRRSRAEMPAISTEINEAEHEGVQIHFLIAPVRVLSQDDRLTGIECIRTELGEPDDSGRRRPIPIKDSEFALDVDNVIIAIGQVVDRVELPEELTYTSWGTLSVDPVTLETNISGVFAGGDVVSGSATVIDAIAAGHKAALSIDRYIRGEGTENMAAPKEIIEVEEEKLTRFAERRERAKMPKLATKDRVSSFKGVELGFSKEAALEEARRCLNCPVCGNCIFDQSQACYETVARLF